MLAAHHEDSDRASLLREALDQFSDAVAIDMAATSARASTVVYVNEALCKLAARAKGHLVGHASCLFWGHRSP